MSSLVLEFEGETFAVVERGSQVSKPTLLCYVAESGLKVKIFLFAPLKSLLKSEAWATEPGETILLAGA